MIMTNPCLQHSHRHQSGLTLIELMIAMLIGLILVSAIGFVFVSSSRSYREDERNARMQDEVRYAMAALTAELEMAGFWGPLLVPGAITLDDSLNDPKCGNDSAGIGWIYVSRTPVFALDNALQADVNTQFNGCIKNVLEGSDVVVIRRVAGSTESAGGGMPFLRTNGTIGTLFRGENPNDPSAIVPAPFADWLFQPSIWFIRNYSVSAGDGIPCLTRLVLQGDPPTFTAASSVQCMAQGIEDLQLEYGVDIDSNGAADQFVTAPDAAQLTRIIEVRVNLLARSTDALPAYRNAKTYAISNADPKTPDDHFYRRAMQTTVFLRNPAALRRLFPTAP